MTLADKYNEIMDRLELSAEARARILANVTEHAAAPENPKGKIIPISAVRRYAAVAACLVVLLLAVFALPKLRQGTTEPPVAMAPGSITEYASAKELSAAMGFPVEELTALPFAPEETGYSNFFDETAQVTYRSGDASVIFRKARGNEDVSGDYNQYADVREEQIGSVTVTLKGNDGAYALALWQKDGFSYALSFDPGVPAQEMTAAVQSLK